MPRTSAPILLLAALSLAAPLSLATKPQAPTLDLDTPAGTMAAMRKIQCSLNDGEPVTYYWHGNMYSRVAGEPDRLLFKVAGMNVRQCRSVSDPEKGAGYRLVSREILLYLDPRTGEVARTWNNPWTGEEVEVLHVANDPVNSTAWTIGRDGQPASWRGSIQGDRWWMTSTIPLFYTNPLAGDYQRYVGGVYHATEMFNFMGDLDGLVDGRLATAPTQVGWVRMSGWLPWMQMSGRDGLVYFHTAGVKLGAWDELPAVMKDEIAANYPEYREPPPLDDERPNETSWTYFMKKVTPKPIGRHR
ncbi:MAG: DUF1838 family protein [Steroidobacteraceae bacterium]